MPGLQAPTAPLLSKSSGSVYTNVNNLRTMRTPAASEAASMGDNLQSQINGIVNTLMHPGALTGLRVTDSTGALIGWIGTQIVNGISYEGAWFEDLYIGGTGPADASISAVGGEVTIVDVDFKLTSNGLETDINNETLPAWGSGVSLVSIDTSVANGDQSFIAPNAMGVFSWTGSALVPVAILADAGSGQGSLQLSGIGNSDQILLGIDPAIITVTDGAVTTSIGPSSVVSPLVTVTNGAGVTTIDPAFVNASAYKVSGVAGVDLTSNMLSAASITAGSINYGSSLTVNTSATGVFGTPAAGQTNGTVVTGVTLNLSLSGIVTAASVTSTSRVWSKGILTT